MQVNPNIVSQALVLWISPKIERHMSTNVDPFAVMPNISLTCDVTIIKLTADVKPDDTGPETKSTRNPKPNIPIKSSITPDVNASRTALCQLPPAVWNVNNADIAVGPIGTSLQLPNIIYIKHPINDPYRPY